MILAAAFINWSAYAQDIGPKSAVIIEAEGVIGPALSDYFQRTRQLAEDRQAGVVVLQLDTPGGLVQSMRQMITDILNSQIPVITYVAPGGARAASAGTYILYASHIAAMAPTTNLGAATPIRVGGVPGIAEKNPKEADDEEKSPDRSPGGTLERKIVNDAVAYITALARRHGRNEQWAEKAVREAVSLTAEDALKAGVIDMVTPNIAQLLSEADGRVVVMEGGKTIRLSTVDLVPFRVPPDWRTKILVVVTDPTVAYVLMILGIYGLIYELANPGFVLPGVVGGICLLLALYTFHVLPINYAGVALILLGMAFMVAEAFAPSFGVLGIGGIIAFVVGSIILVDEESMQVSLFLVGGFAVISFAGILWLMGRLLFISRRKVRTGVEVLIGSVGVVLDDFTAEGRVRLQGESWLAESSTPLKRGQKVRVIEQDGLRLKVKRLEEDVT